MKHASVSPRFPVSLIRAQTDKRVWRGLLLSLVAASSLATPGALASTGEGSELCEPPSLPQATAQERFRWGGELLAYNFEILGANAGVAEIELGVPSTDDEFGEIVPIRGSAESIGLFNAIYPIDNESLTLASYETGLPVWDRKEMNERDNHRTYEVNFHQEEFSAATRRDRRGVISEYTRVLPSDTHDAFTWLVDLRSRPLEVGQEYEYWIYDGWKLSRLSLQVTQHNAVFVLGDLVDCAEVRMIRDVMYSYMPLPWAPEAALSPTYAVREGNIELGSIWFSLDEQRVPVVIEFDSTVGDARLILNEYRPPAVRVNF